MNTARLEGITGSIAKRQKVANQLRAEFRQLVEDTFISKENAGEAPTISIDDMKSYFKQLAPNVKTKVISNLSNAEFYPIYKDKNKLAIKGHILLFPFQNEEKTIRKENQDYLIQLIHDGGGHFPTNITEPKYMLHCTKGKLSPKQHKYQWNFYSKFLYGDITEDLGSLKRLCYKNSKSLRRNFIKEKMHNFFDIEPYSSKIRLYNYSNSQPFSAEEKVDVFQKWRHYLKSEKIAYREQIDFEVDCKFQPKKLIEKLKNNKKVVLKENRRFSKKRLSYNSKDYKTLEERIHGLKIFIEKSKKIRYQETIEKEFSFTEKIKLLEEMLAKELCKAREELRTKRLNSFEACKNSTKKSA